MNNKEILKYLNSKDVRDHLNKISYDFSSLEAIWLIAYHHNITLEKNHCLACYDPLNARFRVLNKYNTILSE